MPKQLVNHTTAEDTVEKILDGSDKRQGWRVQNRITNTPGSGNANFIEVLVQETPTPTYKTIATLNPGEYISEYNYSFHIGFKEDIYVRCAAAGHKVDAYSITL